MAIFSTIVKAIKFFLPKKKIVKGATKKQVIFISTVVGILCLGIGTGLGYFLAKSPEGCKCVCKKEEEIECSENNILDKEDYE